MTPAGNDEKAQTLDASDETPLLRVKLNQEIFNCDTITLADSSDGYPFTMYPDTSNNQLSVATPSHWPTAATAIRSRCTPTPAIINYLCTTTIPTGRLKQSSP